MERQWRIGELAAATGLTVRALHHFDTIGLLRPAGRTSAGHRRYTADDLRRLYRILALRQVGMPLAEIARSLDGQPEDLEAAVRAQLAHVQQHLAAQEHLRRRLNALRQVVRRAAQPSTDQLIETMEATMRASYFTPEELARARQRHQEPGFAERFAGWRRECAAIADEVRAHIEDATDPAAPAVQDLARRWTEVMRQLAGDDRAGLSSIYAKIDGQGPETATRGVLTAGVWEYLKRAFAVGYGPRW